MSNPSALRHLSPEVESEDVPKSGLAPKGFWHESYPESAPSLPQPTLPAGALPAAPSHGSMSALKTPSLPEDLVRSTLPSLRSLVASAEQESTSRRMVDALVAAGVDTFFGIPGGPVSPVFEAVLSTPGARLIESRHESAAAFSAMGYHRATGRVAAVIVTAGPGATNVVTGVTAAFTERVPMLVICGDVPWASGGGRLLQDSGPQGIAVEQMLGHVTRAAIRASRPESVVTQALAAFHAATEPLALGPAVFVLPMDIARAAVPETPAPQIRRTADVYAPPSSVIEAAKWLAEAERPLVIVGAGARPHAALVRKLLDVLHVPFMTTPQAKGLISENHPLSLRHGGLAASWWARRYTQKGVDVALAIGTDLDDCSTGPTPPLATDRVSRLIHVDIDATVFHRNHRAALPILADIKSFAEQLYDVVTTDGIRNPRGLLLVRDIHKTSAFDAPEFASDNSPIIAPHRAVADLEKAAGSNARFVTDIGEHMLSALHYLTAKGPDAFTIHLGLGSMASGITSSIGLALGDPSRRVVCICGDGGMQMAGMELLVAARERLPIVYAVFNDARYNMVYHGYKQLYGAEAGWDTPWVDFEMWAASFGVAGARIEKPGQITTELLDRLTQRGPAVLDIRIDRDKRIRGAGRNESLGHMSVRPTAI
ncbi:MAG: thiamine pyrophosphate-binding protein [Polyangiaceae bacterium]|nr:thiamine pyrophosphate-binding protein [Polyangiaceae bacterium]